MNTKNCDYEKNEIVKHCLEEDYNFIWDEKKAIDGESRLVPKRIWEATVFLKNSKHVNKI